MDTQGKFYLGRIYDPVQAKLSTDPLLYDPGDLTTHAVVVGMTGSGKTGLCVGLLEEAALSGYPALMIDPKGDLTNLLLHFPDLLPSDFQPWVNPDEARRSGKTQEQFAAQAAENWKQGLADWGISPERLRALKDAAHFAIYTPGSDSGIPVSILASLKAPAIPWEDNREILRERISSTVTALLGLVGLNDIDPVRSREHILLSNIFESAWMQGKDLSLNELIMQTQNPPFDKLGVFDVDTFFGQKDRFELAMLLNNILAAPAFQTWIEGVPLDIPSLLYHPDGRPRHSVFYIAHLSDTERMFFVTLLFSAVETWMRTQSGTTSLRALVYFDEIFGYLPPTKNPPSKQPILRMLKQARAFGVGLVLATQNPVDLDYKALSNAGTWMIGKLQTERDKARVLEGLESAAAGTVNASVYDKMISGLGKRIFLIHNVNRKGPQLFQTRWAMNYLAGPLMRSSLRSLNALVGADKEGAAVERISSAGPKTAPAGDATASAAAPGGVAAATTTATPSPSTTATGLGHQTRPAIPTGVVEMFLPHNLTLNAAYKAAGRTPPPGAKNLGILYYPTILAQANVRFLNRKYALDDEQILTALVYAPDKRGVIRWDDYRVPPIDAHALDSTPTPEGRFMTLESPFSDGRLLKSLEKDFADWVFNTAQLTVRANDALKLYAGPQVTSAEFSRQCADAARKARDAELKKALAPIERQIKTMEDRIGRTERELERDEAELSKRKLEEWGTHAENVFGFLTGSKRRKLSSSLSKSRQTSEASAEVRQNEQAIKAYKEELANLIEQRKQQEAEIQQRWGECANQVDEVTITPLKKDVRMDLFGVAWLPCYIIQMGDQTEAVRAFA